MINKHLVVWVIVAGILFGARYAYVRNYGIHLTSQRFIEMAGVDDGAGSMYSLNYDGVREGKAYLDSWEMNRVPRRIVYWTGVDRVPASIRTQMLNGTGRWKVMKMERNSQ